MLISAVRAGLIGFGGSRFWERWALAIMRRPGFWAVTATAILLLLASPIVRLNRAVAVALAGDVEEGLAMIEGIEGLDGYSYLPAARADLLRRLDRTAEAAASYREALALTDNAPERRFLERRLREAAD